MDKCNILNLYTKNNKKELLNYIKSTYTKNDIEFYNSLLEYLKSRFLSYSKDIPNKEEWKDSFRQLYSDIIDGISNIKNVNVENIKEKLANDLQNDLGAKNLRSLTEDILENFLLTEDVNIKNKNLSLNQFIKKVYGGLFGAIKQMKNVFSRELFITSICNFKEGKLILTNDDLNANIANYKDLLLKRISSYLNNINGKLYTNVVFNKNKTINPKYYDVLNDMKEILDDKNIEFSINEEYNRKLFKEKTDKLDAIYAYTILKYFDSLLEESLGKTIKYNSKYKNKEVILNINKYSLSADSSHHRQNWNDSDARSAIENSSKFSKFVLESIPLEINGIDSGKNIGILQFILTMGKLFSQVNKLNKYPNLKNYLLSFHNSVKYNAILICKIINDRNVDLIGVLKRDLQFTDTDLGVIDSIYKYIFSYDEDLNEINYKLAKNQSIGSIEYFSLTKNNSIGEYSIISDIASLMDDAMDASYIYTKYSDEGGAIIEVRNKGKNRRTAYKYIKRVNFQNMNYSNEYRELLKKSAIFTGNIFNVKVQIPFENNFITFNINGSNKKLGILTQSDLIDIVSDDLENVYKLFNSEKLALKSYDKRQKLLSNTNLTKDKKMLISILKYIDDRLLTNFLSEDGLQILNNLKSFYKGNTKILLNDLLLYATKFQLISNIYYDFEQARLNPNNKNYNSRKDFLKFLKTNYPAFNNIGVNEYKIYYHINENIYNLKSIPDSTSWVDWYEKAIAILYGDDNSSVSKNQEGNNDANYTTSFLAGQIHNVAYKARQSENSAAKHLLFTNNDDAIVSCVINSDIKNRKGKVKSIRDLKKPELFYNAIIHNFWKNYVDNGTYCIQPTTYSDKVKLIQYLIDSKYKFNEKELNELDYDELIELYRTTVGAAYEQLLKNVIEIYRVLFEDSNLNIYQINNKLKTYSEESLIELAQSKGIVLKADLDYRKKKINGKNAVEINETLLYNAKYLDKNFLKNKFEQEKVLFINHLVDSGVFFYIDYHDTGLYNKEYHTVNGSEKFKISTNPIANIINSIYKKDSDKNEYYSKWVKNGKLILAKDKNGNDILYKNIDSISEMNPLFEKYFYMDSLLSTNLRLSLTGFETNHPDKSKFKKIWNKTAEGLKINNQLLNSVQNIETLQNAKIIWGHPGLGKTTYLTSNPNSIIEWDNEFNEIRNKFISDKKLDKNKFLENIYQYSLGKGKFTKKQIEIFDEYLNLLDESWNNVKQKALLENKKIFASPIILLNRFKEDFDLVLNIDKENFLNRKPEGEAWKQSIDELLNIIPNKIINVGNLYMYDVMALNDDFDLMSLSQSSNFESVAISEHIINIITNISQNTQLKRNVIIPATLHYMHNGLLEGVSNKIKVAVIEDIKADVFNYLGDFGAIDSMDGSAFTNMLQSILENYSLGSLKVGDDKKTIWHHYDQNSGTSALMKFAAFAINNERMFQYRKSTVSLVNMYKKMTNLQWTDLDDNGNIIEGTWKTLKPIKLGESINFTTFGSKKLDFYNEILGRNNLYYYTYENNQQVYRHIKNFGSDENGYYTIEEDVDTGGFELSEQYRVYHYFDKNSNHVPIKIENDEKIIVPENTHTINSLYELWISMGGMYSHSLNENYKLENSEASQYAVVSFINKTLFLKENGNGLDISQNSYEQPLKTMMIGYLTNNSAMKNGAGNRNSVKRWTDDKKLAYMEMDSDGLGVQMDADHDIEFLSTMTEFSQVISALESGGRLHKYSKMVYYLLGEVALNSANVEINSVINFLTDKDKNYNEVKSDLYDIVTRTILNGIKSREDNANLTDEILKAIEKHFNKNVDHFFDNLKMPFSDPNIYSLIIPIISSVINQKSIKRKYPGAGNVMCPGYNIAQYFRINNIEYLASDLVRKALESGNYTSKFIDNIQFENDILNKYLNDKQLELINQGELSFESISPTDNILIIYENENGVLQLKISLNEIKDYYSFKDNPKAYLFNKFGITFNKISYYKDITTPCNLAPSKISWKYIQDGIEHKMNFYDHPIVKQLFIATINKLDSKIIKNLQNQIQTIFDNLAKKQYVENGKVYEAFDIENIPAEAIMSNMFRNEFGIENKSVALIEEEETNAFKIYYEPPLESNKYDLVFTKINNNHTYISFSEPDKTDSYEPFKESNLLIEKDDSGNLEVYYINDQNIKLFKVGRYILRPSLLYKKAGYEKDGQFISESEGSDELLQQGYNKIKPGFYKGDELIDSKKAKHLKRQGEKVYLYVQFISKYKSKENLTENGDITYILEFDKYYINIDLLLNNKHGFFKFNKQISEEQKQNTINKYISNVLNSLYEQDLYLAIDVNPNTKNKKIIADNLKKINVDYQLKINVINPMIKKLSNDEFIDMSKEFDKYYSTLANDRYVSWKQSLYITSARIPAQTLQSFMQMKTIAYTGNTLNKIYVSHWLAYLQGSDYKI